MVKMNTQAQEIINSIECLWDYTRNFVSHRFKKEVRRLGIKDARFHDLRRTFGYNLIRQVRAHSRLGYRPPAPEVVCPDIQNINLIFVD